MTKVLWIDDENQDGIREYAFDTYEIDTEMCTYWEEAYKILEKDFNKYDAIIFDCYCPIRKGEAPSSLFLKEAMSGLNVLFGQNGKTIPWYILSARTFADDFNNIIGLSVNGQRDESWGDMTYDKNSQEDRDKLFESIVNAVQNQPNTWIRFTYSEVFDVVQKYMPKHTNLLFKILKVLHFPSEGNLFDPNDYWGNLRTILQSVLEVCQTHKLVPAGNYFYDSNDGIIIKNCIKFLTGQTLYMNTGVRITKDDYIYVPESMVSILETVRKQGNSGAHGGVDTRNLHYALYGSALQLCDVLVWLDRCLNEPHFEFSYSDTSGLQISPVLYKKHFVGKTWNVEYAQDIKHYHCENCLLGENEYYKFLEGKKVLINNIDINTDKDTSSDYPVTTSITKSYLKSLYEGKKCTVEYSDGVYHCGMCMIGEGGHLASLVGKKILLNRIYDNKGKQKQLYPFRYDVTYNDIETKFIYSCLEENENGEKNIAKELILNIATLAGDKGGMIIVGMSDDGVSSPDVESDIKHFAQTHELFTEFLKNRFIDALSGKKEAGELISIDYSNLAKHQAQDKHFTIMVSPFCK